ncbi:LamG-like jellyroll fold domain-containing protein [Catenulispora sp. MAP5-51]|uniref:LamG-like jellyroll fold domain-containing protein n=1 Tax=unclassified Catenulispora TaxID=414885 RepID=UPI003516B53F
MLTTTTAITILSPVASPPAAAAATSSSKALTPVKPSALAKPKGPDHKPMAGTPVAAAPVWPQAASAVVSLSGTPAKAGSSAVSVSDAAAGVAVGRAHAAVAEPIDAASPSQVKVDALDQATVTKMHGAGVAFRLTRSDTAALQKTNQETAAAKQAPVSVKIDYSGFRNAYGGDFAGRLQLFAYPSCYATTPTAAGCAMSSAVKSTNDTGAGTLTATVAADGDPVAVAAAKASTSNDAVKADSSGSVYVLMATTASSNGNYAASPLNAGDRWQTDLNSGAFTYSYPMKAPAVPGNVTPTLSLDYNSQSVDGHTAANNPQASDSGIGWSVGQNYVERDYETCAVQGIMVTDKNGNSGPSMDECWDNDNLTLSLNGTTSELIRDTTTSGWRLKDDNGWSVQDLTGAGNGDNDPNAKGEYIVVTTGDGTKYYFGYDESWNGRSPNSAWLVPVFSFGGTAPPACNAGGTGPNFQYCMMPWRWMLDKVVDSHGTTARYFYNTESNLYNMRNGTGTGTYTRGGYLAEIDYGMVAGSGAYGQMILYYGGRCNKGGGNPVLYYPDPCPTLSSATASQWPDIPWDLQCTAAPCSNVGPSFWSQWALSHVVTNVYDPVANGMRSVDAWDFSYFFPHTSNQVPPGTDSNGTPALWLGEIQHHGWDNGAVDEAPVYTYGLQYNNLLMTSNPATSTPLNMYRLTAISNELGAETDVQYGTPSACVAATPPAQDSSIADCFEEPDPPSPTAPSPGTYHWYVKYQVTATSTFDLVADSSTGNQIVENTQYQYGKNTAHFVTGEGLGAAWHMAHPLVSTSPDYDDYRGYQVVEVIKGEPTSNSALFSIGTMESVDDYMFYRGQYDDYKTSDKTYRAEMLYPRPDLNGKAQASLPDYDALAGKMLQHIQYYPNGGTAVAWDQHQYLVRTTATGYPLPNDRTHNAYQVTNDNDFSQGLKAAGGGREVQTASAIDAFGNVTQLEHYGETGVNTNEYCTATTFSQSADHTWEVPYDVKTLAGTCSGQLSAETFLYYDNQATWGSSPIQGDVTKTVKAPGMNQTVTTTASYDSYGRVITSTDADGNQSTTAYSPSFGNVSVVTTTDAEGHATSTNYDVARQLPVEVTDSNGNSTFETYDALGRLTSVKLPTDPSGSPSYKFTYNIAYTKPTGGDTTGGRSGGANTNVPANTETQKLQADGSYSASYTFVDGLGRTIETQTPTAGGFSVSTAGYDSLGRKTLTEGPNFLTSGLGTYQLWGPGNNNDGVSTQTWYDELSRPVKSTNFYNRQPVTRNGLAETTTTTYFADQTTVNPPAPNGAYTTTKVDGFGDQSEVDQPGPAGSTVTTKYGYDVLGDLTGITDNAGHQTTYGYDWMGRRLTTSDPDAGPSATHYDGAGNVIQTQDANGALLSTAYDSANRKTATEINDGAVGVWYLNESAPNRNTPNMAADASGNQHNATQVIGSNPLPSTSQTLGNPGPKPGLFATGFDGTTAYDATAGSILDTTKSFSVSAWVKPSAGDTGTETILTQDANKTGGFDLNWTPSGWSFGRHETDDPTSWYDGAASTSSTTGAWTHLVATYDVTSGNMVLYVNGQQAGTANDTYPIASNGPLTIGAGFANGAATQFFGGSISDVRVYSTALTAAQATTLYNRGAIDGSVDPAEAYTYDNQAGGFGKPSTATSYSSAGAYTVAGNGYDAQGRSLGTSWNIPASEGALAGTYTIPITYDIGGNQNTIKYPAAGGLAAETVTTNFNNLSQPTTVNGDLGTYVTNTTFDGLGRISGRTLGNSGLGQTVRSYSYEPDTEALSGIGATATNSAGTVQIQADTYNRDAAGNVTSIDSPVQNQCFTYDGMSEMTQAFTSDSATCASANHTYGPSPYDVTYGIDGLGDILQTTDNITGNVHIEQYNDPKHEHALTNDGGDIYGYDANGNMTSRTVSGTASTLDWNEQQQLDSVTQGANTTTFVYAADGTRLIRHDPGTNQATLFLDGEELVLNGSAVTADRTYVAGGTTVAERTPTALTWLLNDAQGSAQITVNAATGAVNRQYYTPYGAQRNGNVLQPSTDKGFLGQVDDYGTGLIDDGARYYDPAVGHFISPDPVNNASPSQLNAYDYAGDNPETATDPSGLMAIMGGNGNGDGTDGCSNPNTVACEGVLDQAHADLDSAILRAESNADAGDGHALGQVAKFLYHGSGASGVVGCAAHPSVSGCAQAAATVAIAVATDGASAVGETVAETAGKDLLETGAKDAAEAGADDAAADGADAAGNCTDIEPHSFTAPTPVLMGDGSSKPIGQVKVGDIVSNADPASHTEQKHRVDAVIVTHTDHDFADVTVATANGDQTIHTTYHHPFYVVGKSSFVEAADLKAGDTLKTPDGRTVAVTAVRLFHASQTTYDLTIDGLHTYYVEAGDTPVLVHNCGNLDKDYDVAGGHAKDHVGLSDEDLKERAKKIDGPASSLDPATAQANIDAILDGVDLNKWAAQNATGSQRYLRGSFKDVVGRVSDAEGNVSDAHNILLTIRRVDKGGGHKGAWIVYTISAS